MHKITECQLSRDGCGASIFSPFGLGGSTDIPHPGNSTARHAHCQKTLPRPWWRPLLVVLVILVNKNKMAAVLIVSLPLVCPRCLSNECMHRLIPVQQETSMCSCDMNLILFNNNYEHNQPIPGFHRIGAVSRRHLRGRLLAAICRLQCKGEHNILLCSLWSKVVGFIMLHGTSSPGGTELCCMNRVHYFALFVI